MSHTAVRVSGAERRELVLEAAGRVFGRLGYEATRMADVADEAGVATGLLYKHFPSKHALFSALIDRQKRDFLGELGEALASVDRSRPVELLRQGLAVWFGRVARPDFHTDDPGTHDAYRELENQFTRVIAQAMQAAEPRAPKEAVWILAAAVNGAAHAAGEAWLEQPGSLSQAETLDLVARLIWDGLAGLTRELDEIDPPSPSEARDAHA
jgi:AcrR family transcriptional regulator